jgi:hypothetical protein
VNVGAATGEKAGTATCDWRMMNTVNNSAGSGK